MLPGAPVMFATSNQPVKSSAIRTTYCAPAELLRADTLRARTRPWRVVGSIASAETATPAGSGCGAAPAHAASSRPAVAQPGARRESFSASPPKPAPPQRPPRCETLLGAAFQPASVTCGRWS